MQTIVSDQPRFVPTLMADKTSAYAVFSAILAAVVHRERGGGGQAVEVPMFETMVDFVMVEHLYGATFDPPIAQMGYERLLNTERRPYATLDGYLTVLPYTDKNWADFFRIVGREELSEDAIFGSHSERVRNSETVYGFLAEIVATRTTADWVRALDDANIPVMVVQSKEDLLEHEQLRATGFLAQRRASNRRPAQVYRSAIALFQITIFDPHHAANTRTTKSGDFVRGRLFSR